MTKVPYEYMEDTLDWMRLELDRIITQEQRAAVELGEDPGSPYVQNQSYDRFRASITNEDIKRFNEEFNALNGQRDKTLTEKVSESMTLVKNWHPQKNLVDAHFLKTIAKDQYAIIKNDKIIHEVKPRIVPISGYFNEENIDVVINKEPYKYLPEFRRPNGKFAEYDAMELLSISNVSGVYDPLYLNPKKDLLDILIYQFHSRIKRSEREKIKAVDWVLGLRSVDDYPYDGIGIIPIFPDAGYDRRECGELMYRYVDYVRSLSAKDKKFIMKHIQTKTENRETGIIKLLKRYDKDNFDQIIRQVIETERLANEKRSQNKEYIITKEEREKMMQGPQIKCHINGDRAEIWIMNQMIYEIYANSELMGHTDEYIWRRDAEREAYLHNPALSDGLKGKYEGKINPIEPSRAIIAKKLEEELFNQMFAINKYGKVA